MCRTSPSRYSPVTVGRRPVSPATSRATSRIETGRPEQTLYAAKPRRSAPSTTASRASRLARATSSTCTKSRICPPSSKTRGGSPRSSGGPEHRRDPGVRRVPGHARAVDVVVAQGDHRAAGLARPGRRVVLLGQLAGGIAAARVEPGVLARRAPSPSGPPQTGQGFSNRPASRSTADRGPGAAAPCSRARVATLAVDHHRRREHQSADAGLVHRGEQRGGEECQGMVVADEDPGFQFQKLLKFRVSAIDLEEGGFAC